MNRESEFERWLAEWLEEGPVAAPDHDIEAAIARARTHPRRQLLPLVFRRSAMSEIHATPGASRRLQHFGRAFAIGAVAVLAIVFVSGTAWLYMRGAGTGGPAAVPPATQGYIFWADHKDGTIGRANLDGTGVNPSFITGATSACDVSVIGRYIYWGDDQDNTIGRANLDGTGVNPTFITGTGGACGVASDGKYLYWTTRNGQAGTIARANPDGTGVNQSFIGLSGGTNFLGLAISGSYVYWSNIYPQIGRADLGSGGTDNSYMALSGAPSGIAIGGNYIYWGNGGGTTIGRAKLDGTGVTESFISIAGNPGGLATDGTYLYWTAAGSIGRANLDGTGVNGSFISGAWVPIGVAIAR